MSGYKLRAGCPRPGCGRIPSVRFKESQLIHARRERQGALIMEVQCGRDIPFRCRTRWWIRARDIAEAEPDAPMAAPPPPPPANVESRWPEGFPERAFEALQAAGIGSARELRSIDDWLSIPGIGPATERQMRAALDTTADPVLP